MLFLRRWYQRNKRKLWWTIGILGGAILITQLLNQIAIRSINNKKENISFINTTINTISREENTPVVTRDEPDSEKADKVNNVIHSFLDNCNNGNIKEAYNLLTDNCKQELYPTLELFKQKYIDNVFRTKKLYNIQSWIIGEGYTYQITIRENVLSLRKCRRYRCGRRLFYCNRRG